MSYVTFMLLVWGAIMVLTFWFFSEDYGVTLATVIGFNVWMATYEIIETIKDKR